MRADLVIGVRNEDPIQIDTIGADCDVIEEPPEPHSAFVSVLLAVAARSGTIHFLERDAHVFRVLES